MKLIGIFFILIFLWTNQGFASSIHSCRGKIYRTGKIKKKIRKIQCHVKISGERIRVGDLVEVRNEHSFIVATGRVITKQTPSRPYALIVLNKIYKAVKTGYPVFLRKNENIDYLTVTKAPN